jgi:CheY-like chemotaxis protein
LQQVFANLLNNAAKYTPPEGQITVTASREGAQAVVRVKDNGVGISPETLPRIFDLFTQAERTLDRSQGGLGIGLTLARRLVELHDGKMEAQSAGPGKGSEFVVRLPLLLEVPQVLPEAPATAQREAQRSLKVLIVDDNDDACESLSLLLRMNGYDTHIAKDGPSALEAARLFDPEVAILDIGLPALDGYQVAKRLREQPATKNAVLIAVTGYGQDADKERSKEAGFDYHLVKPVDPEKLQQILTMLAYHQGESPGSGKAD